MENDWFKILLQQVLIVLENNFKIKPNLLFGKSNIKNTKANFLDNASIDGSNARRDKMSQVSSKIKKILHFSNNPKFSEIIYVELEELRELIKVVVLTSLQ